MILKEAEILLIDDSVSMRQTIKNILVSAGYRNITMAADGKDGLSKLAQSIERGAQFKLIFLDWNMPEMDGMEFLKICRGDPRTKDIAIIMLTAVADQKSVISAMNSGATSYIIKPVSAETLTKKIDQVSQWMSRKNAQA